MKPIFNQYQKYKMTPVTYSHSLLFCLLMTLISNYTFGQDGADTSDVDFKSFQMDALLKNMDQSNSPWLGFFKGKNVLTGVYRLKVGAEDQQKPHDTDEIYYVISGQSRFKAGNHDEAVKPGSVLFVKADVAHQFYDINEELVLLVFFDQ